MREIKFRAWHRDSKRMLQVGDDCGTTHPLDCCVYFKQGQPVELMQYTGLKDKNGLEIYEGDLVSYRLNGQYLAKVYFDDRTAGYRLRVNGETQFDKTYPVDFILEVIGNIYESPELLEV